MHESVRLIDERSHPRARGGPGGGGFVRREQRGFSASRRAAGESTVGSYPYLDGRRWCHCLSRTVLPVALRLGVIAGFGRVAFVILVRGGVASSAGKQIIGVEQQAVGKVAAGPRRGYSRPPVRLPCRNHGGAVSSRWSRRQVPRGRRIVNLRRWIKHPANYVVEHHTPDVAQEFGYPHEFAWTIAFLTRDVGCKPPSPGRLLPTRSPARECLRPKTRAFAW